MKKIQFKCTLLSDVIVSQKSATEGSHKTLDFIPGNSFLGIVASGCYAALNEQDQILLFHSGKVRFGDAHPAVEYEGQEFRSLKIPAIMFSPKLSDMNPLYIHSAISDNEILLPKQLKQCRNGFYAFADTKIVPAESERNYAIKSAYDRDARRSATGKMYGYESLPKGMKFLFEVELDEEAFHLETYITDCLLGNKRVGRSRTAQYGWVSIEKAAYGEYPAAESADQFVLVYAEGRVIFLDDDGMPTFRPSVSQLGFGADAKLVPELSQIRTFQYAPWNFKRQAFDTDRCGIEKGSVWVVRTKEKPENAAAYIGSYRNEGFGKVLYNPDFLSAQPGQNGLAVYQLANMNELVNTTVVNEMKQVAEAYSDVLVRLLRKKKKEQEQNTLVYKMVNDFVHENQRRYGQENFASQWGTIRSLAMQATDRQSLYDALFTEPLGYLVHGIGERKWNRNRRREKLKEFFKQTTEENFRFCLINLASEMAKKSRRG